MYRALQEQGTLKLHQLWFLKHRDAASEEERVKVAVAEAATALESRLAELRAVEAELESVRQAHYAANDELHATPGCPGRGGAGGEPARGTHPLCRRRPPARRGPAGRADGAERAVGRAPGGGRRANSKAIAAQIVAGDEQAGVLAAQAEEQALELPALRGRRARRAGGQQPAACAGVAGAAADPGAGGREPQRGRTVAPAQGPARAPGRRTAGPAGARRGAPRQPSRPRRPSASEALQLAEARLHELAEQVPSLDEQRRAAQEAVNRESGRLADIGARLEALRALQEKVQTEGKLKPWLDKHGLGGLQGLWTQVHIEPGWETALESALRERLNALAVGRLDTVRAFAADAPPAKLAFYALPAGAPCAARRTRRCRAWPTCCAWATPGLKALLGDWLEGVYTAVVDRRRAGPAHQPDARRSDHDARRPRRVAARGGLLRARLRTGRHAGARAGDREPRPPAARAGAHRRRGAQRLGAAGSRVHRRLAATAGRRAARPPRRRTARTACTWNCCA